MTKNIRERGTPGAIEVTLGNTVEMNADRDEPHCSRVWPLIPESEVFSSLLEISSQLLGFCVSSRK